jgi:hypothetical protein
LNQGQFVRQQSPGKPVATSAQAARQTQSEDGFRSFTSPPGNTPAKTAPRVWEEQGTPELPTNSQPQETAAKSGQPSRPPGQTQRAAKSPNPLVKPAPPVQAKNDQQQEEKYSAWHQQKSWSSGAASKGQSSEAKSASAEPHK